MLFSYTITLPSHTALLTNNHLLIWAEKYCLHSSLDLAPSDDSLFVWGQATTSNKKVNSALQNWLHSQPKEFLSTRIGAMEELYFKKGLLHRKMMYI